MEDIPPSYDEAIDREAWTVIAPYIASPDLCAACLVSRRWHSTFVRFLWGDPASHFGIENDAVYVALTRFKRTLRKARLGVRALTHTLHLPPALSEIYGGPNPAWLRDVLEQLPNLQSLIVAKLPFFDHHSLIALKPNNTRRISIDGVAEAPSFGLKLLLASSEPNTTSTGLATALPRFSHLVYLDLSFTTSARDPSVLSALSLLPDLQVLKLQGLGLRDGELEILAGAIGIRVRLLDVRDNALTDASVQSLLEACFLPLDHPAEASRLNTRRVEDWPVGMAPGPDFFSLDTLRSDSLDHKLLKQLTHPLTGRLAFEDIPHRGLTHLYIANNRLSVEGVSNLLKSQRLHILDAGTVHSIKTITRAKSVTSRSPYIDEVRILGAEKLIPILAQIASQTLTYLRLDHSVVTKTMEVPPETNGTPTPTPKLNELQGDQAPVEMSTSREILEAPGSNHFAVEAPAPAHWPTEMSADQTIFELDSTPIESCDQVQGEQLHDTAHTHSSDSTKVKVLSDKVEVKPVRAEGSFAPKPVRPSGEEILSVQLFNPDTISSHNSIQQTPATVQPNGTLQAASNQLASNNPFRRTEESTMQSSSSQESHNANLNQTVKSAARQKVVTSLLAKRPFPLSRVTNETNRAKMDMGSFLTLTNLHPCALPNLRTLVLTSVPMTIPFGSKALENLKAFITACGQESLLAALQAKTNYSLPPGRARAAAEQAHARGLFALQTIILEMAQPNAAGDASPLQRGWKHTRERVGLGKSAAGDVDSENLWEAAANDFSFFGEEGEEVDECGIYENEPDKYFPTAIADEKFTISPEENLTTTTISPLASSPGRNDMVSRYGSTLRSPRDLPLGRNRRSSNEAQKGSRPLSAELQGSPNNSFGRPVTPRSMPAAPPEIPQRPKIDVIAELAAWRKEKKKAYEDLIKRHRRSFSGENDTPSIDNEILFVDGHWKGEIKVVRNAAPKGRSGVVDMYGNYFEKGYLYP